MANLFSRPPRRVETPKLGSREDAAATTKVDLVEFAPPLLEFLGRAAYVQLALFENLSRTISSAPTVAAKTAIGLAAELSITRHRALTAEIDKVGGNAAAAMQPFTAPIDEFQRITQGADWYENLVTCYLTGGILDDFFARLAHGLAADAARRVVEIYAGASGESVLAAELGTAIAADPRLASRLALWGRRLVGDTLLVARSALHYSDDHHSDEARIEPVFTELIAAHTRRMDALGLTA